MRVGECCETSAQCRPFVDAEGASESVARVPQATVSSLSCFPSAEPSRCPPRRLGSSGWKSPAADRGLIHLPCAVLDSSHICLTDGDATADKVDDAAHLNADVEQHGGTSKIPDWSQSPCTRRLLASTEPDPWDSKKQEPGIRDCSSIADNPDT